MKKTFTITLILLGCMTAMGQTKPKEYIGETMPNSMMGTVTTPYLAIKIDTVSCWFKDIIISKAPMDTAITNGHLNLNNAVLELWQHGYSISNNRSIRVEYLYADRKTRVTNTVIYSITK